MGGENGPFADFKTRQLSCLLLSHPEVQHQQTWTHWWLDHVYTCVEGKGCHWGTVFLWMWCFFSPQPLQLFWLITEIHDCLKFKLMFMDGKFTYFKLVSVIWNSLWYPEFIKHRIKITKASSWRCQIKATVCGFMYFLFLYLNHISILMPGNPVLY